MLRKYILYIAIFVALTFIVGICIVYLTEEDKEAPFLTALEGPYKVRPDKNQEVLKSDYNPIYDQIKSQKYGGDEVKLVPHPEKPMKLAKTKDASDKGLAKPQIMSKSGLDIIIGKEVDNSKRKKFKGSVKGIYALVTSTRNREEAELEFKKILRAHSKLIKAIGYRIEKFDIKNKGRYYRLMIGPTGTAGRAQLICKKLIESGKSCIIKKF